MIPFIWNIQKRQVPRDKKQIIGCKGQGEWGNRKWLLNGYRVSFRGDKNVLELNGSDGCINIANVLTATESHTLTWLMVNFMLLNFTSIYKKQPRVVKWRRTLHKFSNLSCPLWKRKVSHTGLTISSSIIQIKLEQLRLEIDPLSINLKELDIQAAKGHWRKRIWKILRELYLQASLSAYQLLRLWLKAKVPRKASSVPTPGKRAFHFYVKSSHGEFHIMEHPWLPSMERFTYSGRVSFICLYLRWGR